MFIKAGFSRRIPTGERRNNSRIAKGERGIWQRRYWEHVIRDDRDFARHADYIHYNPVKHGYVQRVADWPYSSFHREVGCGVYTPDWAGAPESDLGTGEGGAAGLARREEDFAGERIVPFVENLNHLGCAASKQ